MVFLLISGCTGPKKATSVQPEVVDNISNVTDNSSEVTPPPETCFDNGTPVCGTDGVTYSHACLAEDAGIEYVQGECIACTDSDSDNIYVQGIVRDASATHEDVCASEQSVVEYTCDTNRFSQKTVACAAGFVCESGACKALPSACTDTDNKDPTKKGTVTVKGVSQTDSCYNQDQVTEYVCLNDRSTFSRISCPIGTMCFDGACTLNPNACVETDDGEDPQHAGNITLVKNGFKFYYSDSCYNTDFVKEYSCTSEGTVRSNLVSCGSNSTCSDNACRFELDLDGAIIVSDSESVCAETDDGIDVDTKGTAFKGKNLEYIDSCNNDHNVKEYFCVDNVLAYKLVNCKSYQTCSSGRCIDLSCTDSDGGVDVFTKGEFTIEGKDYVYEDYCQTSHSVFEYFCGADSKLFGDNVECPSGICVSGVCRP